MVTGLNHITLATSDLARSIGFYRDLLGATLRAHWAGGAYLELGDIWLCLMQTADDIPVRTDYTHLAFSCEAAEFTALSDRIQTQAELWQENRSHGASLYFLDPDGHRLELHLGDLETRLAHYRAHPEKGVTVIG
ncbi:VOC family protein [Aliiroseovarius crassostreae]|uniref:VOC family protein n=1 Tax=Aliiroseovarius crassostreae TaxID=154981 RepID=UPI0021FD36E1|nr:VOC family protein [Aliiroseovarius crassostreae]UWQ09542.1 VOC family protein [Aliiroseovarius crassostreae]UWQ12629.1 VOC family protein [Aliiroseovarius crassostreae]